MCKKKIKFCSGQCEVIRYRLVQVRQNLKKKRLFGLAARNRLSLSLPLSFSPSSYFLSFSIQKFVCTARFLCLPFHPVTVPALTPTFVSVPTHNSPSTEDRKHNNNNNNNNNNKQQPQQRQQQQQLQKQQQQQQQQTK